MSGFNSSSEGDFDRVFMNSSEFFDQFVGNQIFTFGYNNIGQLGNGTSFPGGIATPANTIGGGTNWKQVACGNQTSAAIKTDGTLWTWGYNSYGELGNGTTAPRSSPGTTAGGGTNWKQVAVGEQVVAAIKTDGTLWTCGYQGLGGGVTTNRSSPGTVAGGGTNWKQVAGGYLFTAAVKTDGTLWTWGYNATGALGNGNITDTTSPVTTIGGQGNWKQVACGYHTAAIKTDGTLWTWGTDTYGQLGHNTSSVNTSSPVTTAGGGTNWKQVACGSYQTAAIKTDGTLWTWGRDTYGQLGDGTTSNRSSPGTTAGGGTNWKQVASGMSHVTAVKTDGTLWTWGRDNFGQLGDNTTVNKSSPVTVFGNITNWKQVECGTYYTAAIGY